MRFWVLVALIGVCAGLGGGVALKFLELVEHLVWGYKHGFLLGAIERTSALHRVVALALGGVIAGLGSLLLMRLKSGMEVSEALWLRDGRMPLLPTIARAVDSLVAVGFGASLGLEAAPQQIGASFASAASDWARLPTWQRRLLVASGAGAGMAAVYNMPLGGALFAVEVMLGSITLPLVLPALVMTVAATASAWIVLGNVPTYFAPSFTVHASQIVWAIIVGPLAGLVGVVWIRIVARAYAARPKLPLRRALAPPLVFTALGLVAIKYPQLLGNGKSMVQIALLGRLSIGLFAALLVLKPLMTGGAVGSGVPGGLFTPTLAIGTMLGGVAGSLWIHLWPGASVGSYAFIGGAAMLGAAMQGPISAVVMVLELAPGGTGVVVPIVIAVAGGTIVARIVGEHSIFAVRVAERWSDEGRPALESVLPE